MSQSRENYSTQITFPNSLWGAFARGLRLKCPRCGQAKLFQSYLKPVEHCATCGKKWDTVRADLAPAWAAMTLSAHVIILVYHFFFFDKPIANWLATSIMIAIASLICLVSLPAFKGLFMALIWWNRLEKEHV